jgi:hypothetical protein
LQKVVLINVGGVDFFSFFLLPLWEPSMGTSHRLPNR